MLLPRPPADLGHVGGGQDHRDELHEGHQDTHTDVGHQHGLDVLDHLVPEDLHAAVLPDVEVGVSGSVGGQGYLALPAPGLHTVTAGVRDVARHDPVPVLVPDLVVKSSATSQRLLQSVPGRPHGLALRVVGHVLEGGEVDNDQELGVTDLGEVVVRDGVLVYRVPQLYGAEHGEDLTQERQAQEDGHENDEHSSVKQLESDSTEIF